MPNFLRSALTVGAVAMALSTTQATADPVTVSETDLHAKYSGYLGPLKVIDVDLKSIYAPQTYRSSVRMKSTGFAALFGKFDTAATVTGYTQPKLRPVEFNHTHTGKKTRSTQVRWTDDTVIATANPPHGNLGNPPASTQQKLEATDTLTILAALTRPGVDLSKACDATYAAFDGKQRYDLTLEPLGPVEITPNITSAVSGPGYKCLMRYKEVAGYDEKLDRDEAFRAPITVWIAEVPGAKHRAIARFEADMGWFSAVVKLKQLDHLRPQTSGAQASASLTR